MEEKYKYMRKDKEVVLAAVQQDGLALKYASDKLRNDKDIVLAAVQKDPKAIRFASYELRKKKNTMMIGKDN